MSDVSIAGASVASGAEASAAPLRGALGFRLLLPLLIVAMELAVSLVEPRVLSLRNIINILVQSSYLLLFASAQMVVILTRGFDLSLGMAVSVISVATALADDRLRGGRRAGMARCAAGLAVGLGVGRWSAFSTGYSSPGSASIRSS